MSTLIAIELYKIFRKWRTYIGFAAIVVIVAIVQLSMYMEGASYLDFIMKSIKETFEFSGDLINGYLIANIILQTLFIHIPFLVVLVGGDLLAGEATAGTYRLLVTRPVSRSSIITAKFIAGLVYTNLLIVCLMIFSLFGSILIFGTGELIVMQDKIYVFAADDVMWRFMVSYGYASLSMSVVFALSFLFSVLVENAIGPIVATMAVIIVFLIISVLNFELLNAIKPALFVTHMNKWREFMRDPLDYSNIITSAVILFAHIIILYAATIIIFNKKDILT